MTASFDFLDSSAEFAEEELKDMEDFLMQPIPRDMQPKLCCKLGDIELSASQTNFRIAGAHTLTVSTIWVNYPDSICIVTDPHNNEVFHQQFEFVYCDGFFCQSIDLDFNTRGNGCSFFMITVQTSEETYQYPVHFCDPTITCFPSHAGEPIQSIHDNVWQLWTRSYKFNMRICNLHGPHNLRAYVQSYELDGIKRKKPGEIISLDTLTAPPIDQHELDSLSLELPVVNPEEGTYSGTFEMKVKKKMDHSVAFHGRMKVLIDVYTAEQLPVRSTTMFLVVTKRPTDKKPRKQQLLTTSQISQQLELLQQSVQHLLQNSMCPDDIQEVKNSLDRASDSFKCYLRTR